MSRRYKWQEKYLHTGTMLSEGGEFPYIDKYEINGNFFYVRRDSIDETIWENIFSEECYEPNLWFNRNLREEFYLKNVEYIFDIGANIGGASCYFAQKFPKAKIFSFEVEKNNFELLKMNTKAYPNVSVYNKAIWKDEEGVFISNRSQIYGHSGRPNPAKYMVGSEPAEGEEKIGSTSLSTVLQEQKIKKIDILKMDIQGAEIEAFEDAHLWLPYVRVLFIELHDLFREGCSKKVFNEIVKNGKFLFIGSPNGEILVFLRRDELCE